jgi:methionyl-tRNA formyltransferase
LPPRADAAVVVAYGLLLPKPVLERRALAASTSTPRCCRAGAGPPPSSAPSWRAMPRPASPSCAWRRGWIPDRCSRLARLAITPQTTAASLHDDLAALGARLIVETLQAPEQPGTPQPAEGVTYARKIDKTEARIDFTRPAAEVRNHIHGLSPFPGAWTMIGNVRVKVLKAEAVGGAGEPGTALDDGLTIACGTGAIRLMKCSARARAPWLAEQLLRGLPVPAGTRLG